MKNTLFLLACLLVSSLLAQEVVSPLTVNENLSKEVISKKSLSIVNLPFFDDFSDYKGYPNPNLWQDNDAYINTTLPINPLNIGVATLDGLDSLGNPRNITNASSQGDADYLTSKIIDLSANTEVYMSFYYQSKGLGNMPDSEDFLSLEFYNNNTGFWDEVWFTISDAEITNFQRHDVLIDQAQYLNQNFKFRFHNLATLSGNFDHWHLDNILITNSLEESINTDDVAFVYETANVLNFYTSIPWPHFMSNGSSYIKSTMDSWLRNNYSFDQGIGYFYDVYDEDDNLIFNYPVGEVFRNDAVFPFVDYNFSYSEHSSPEIIFSANAFPSNSNSSASFTIVQNILNDDADLFLTNNTLNVTQEFANYYSLDDGTAEAAYGVNVAGAKVAIRFTIAKEDTLTAVQMHFEQNLEDASSSPFLITVWEDDNGNPGDIIYQDGVSFVEYTDEQNGFFEYELDESILVDGSIFIGWEQSYSQLLNIGLDKNIINNVNRMRYNTGSVWDTSSCLECLGTWMIRPVFGSLNSTSNIITLEASNLNLYPNPSSSLITIEYSDAFRFKVYNLSSVLIHEVKKKSNIQTFDCSILPKGIYIVEVISSSQILHQKIIVQ